MVKREIEFLESLAKELSGIDRKELTKAEKNILHKIESRLMDLYSVLSEDD